MIGFQKLNDKFYFITIVYLKLIRKLINYFISNLFNNKINLFIIDTLIFPYKSPIIKKPKTKYVQKFLKK